MTATGYQFGPFRFDRVACQVARGAEIVSLTPKLLDLLVYLLDRPATLVTKEELLDALWPGANVTENALARPSPSWGRSSGTMHQPRSSSAPSPGAGRSWRECFRRGCWSGGMAGVRTPTAPPKGVQLTHRNLRANVHAIAQVFDMRHQDVMIGVLPFFCFTGTLWFPLITGVGAAYHPNPIDAKTIGELT